MLEKAPQYMGPRVSILSTLSGPLNTPKVEPTHFPSNKTYVSRQEGS